MVALTLAQEEVRGLLDEIDTISLVGSLHTDVGGMKFPETISNARKLSPENMLDAALLLRLQIKYDESFRLAEMAFEQITLQDTFSSDSMVQTYKPMVETLAVYSTSVNEATFGAIQWEYFYSSASKDKKLFYNFGVGFLRHHKSGVETMVKALKRVLSQQIVEAKRQKSH